jgi:hypothetical protein
MVRRAEDKEDGCVITGLVDWDNCEAAPSALAYTVPGWLWAPEDTDDDDDSDVSEFDWDPDFVPNDPTDRRVRAAFVAEVERLVPGFVSEVRDSRERQLKKLLEVARWGLCSNEMFVAAHALVDLAAKRRAAAEPRRSSDDDESKIEEIAV